MRGPLAGLRVIELTHVWSGPLCGQILADLGAEVIRVENRGRLDIHRRGGPYPDNVPGINRSGTWNAQNRGKLSCTLDLKKPTGKDLLLELVAKSQVVIENFTPGTLARLGLGFPVLSQVNPRLVLLSLTGFGQDGPYRDAMAYGPMMDAATGLSAATAYGDGVPRAVNGWAADVGGALYGCAAVIRALLEKEPEAVHLDVSQYESGVLFALDALLVGANGREPDADRARELALVFESAEPDRWIAIAARSLSEMDALGALVGGPELAVRIIRLLRADGVRAAAAVVREPAEAWARTLSSAEALKTLHAAGIPAVPVTTVVDLMNDAMLREGGAWVETIHPEVGRILSYGPSIHLSGQVQEWRAAPCLGEHNEYVFQDIVGLSIRRMKELREDEVI